MLPKNLSLIGHNREKAWCMVSCRKSVVIFQFTTKLINSSEFPAMAFRKQLMTHMVSLSYNSKSR